MAWDQDGHISPEDFAKQLWCRTGSGVERGNRPFRVRNFILSFHPHLPTEFNLCCYASVTTCSEIFPRHGIFISAHARILTSQIGLGQAWHKYSAEVRWPHKCPAFNVNASWQIHLTVDARFCFWLHLYMGLSSEINAWLWTHSSCLRQKLLVRFLTLQRIGLVPCTR